MAIIEVVHHWSDEYGHCEDCGDPAAYEYIDAYGLGQHKLLDSVCAAQAAAEGAIIRWLFREPNA